MKLRHALSFLSLMATTACLAQNDNVIDVAVPQREEAHDPNEPFTLVEVMPEYPGGQDAMFAYIGNTLKYPKEAMEKGIQGTVIVNFVVERDGSVNEVKTLRGIGGGCDEEAVRVVRGMPNWKPGKQRGEAVRVKYNLPIRYKLTGSQQK
ncbi:MAG: energy transducer TonB [Flavobacteriales bacterium]|nr:MAG: energy transducer TonB [Flavobacteriales bacterium]